MPAMLPAAAATTALGTTAAAVGTGAALSSGIAAGATLAGGAGIFSNFMAGAAPGLAGTLGGVSAPVAASIAPAATSQLMGTIGGSVAPGAFGANLAGSAGAGAFNPATAQTLGTDFLAKSQAAGMPIANPNNPLLRSSLASGTNMMPAQPLTSQAASGTGNLAETIRNTNTAMRGNVPISYAEGAQGIAPNAFAAPASNIQPGQNFIQNLGNIGSFQDVKDYAVEHPYATSAMAGLGAMGISKLMQSKDIEKPEDKAMIRPYTYERTQRPEAYETSPSTDSSERLYFNDQFVAGTPYKASEKAEGGIASAYAVGGPVEQMAAMNATGANTGYPMADLQTPIYTNPAMQRPEATNVVAPSADVGVSAYTGEPRFAKGGETETEGGYSYSYDPNTMQFTQLSVPTIKPYRNPILGINPDPLAPPQPVKNSGSKLSGGIATPAAGPMQMQQLAPVNVPPYQSPEQQLGLGGFYDYMNSQLGSYGGYGGYAAGGGIRGESHLGDYSDGGRLLKGPGDGVSDSIPASIGGRQPARLADGEFVIPARIVSELGNGSTEAGARKLYAMMERVQASRKKSIGKKKVAVNSKADKHLPA